MIRLGIGALLLGGLLYLWKTGKLSANAFGYSMKGYGAPSVNGTTIDLPVNIEFTNPTPLAVNLDNVTAQLYINKGGAWINVANVNQALSIPAGTATQKVNAHIDLGKIVGGNILETLDLASSILAQQTAQVRTDLTVTYAGITLPQQSFTSNIQVG
jgi:hypothetical protein